MQRLEYVGLLDTFRRPIVQAATAQLEQPRTIRAGIVDPSTFPIASPWSSSTLQRIVFEDVFGSEIPVNTRSAAMKIAAVARGRGLIVSAICGLPLVAMRGEEEIADQPTWLYRADDGTPPELRLAYTVDDLFFYGWSCWWRRNGADGFPIAVGRLNQDDWTMNADMRVVVRGQVQRDNEVIVFRGLHEGILTHGVDVLGDARDLYRNVRRRIANPVPGLELHQVGGEELDDDEIDALVAGWAAVRAGVNGAVGYTNEFIETKELGTQSDAQLMIEARNAAAVDLARMMGISAGMIDATAPKASLNYETQTGRNQEFVDLDLNQYMTPITARLSLDDVCPKGQRIVFDRSDLTGPAPSPTGPAFQD